MKIFIVYYGSLHEGAGVDAIYVNEKNAIKRAMRLVLRNLSIDAVKDEDSWMWHDEHSLIAVKPHTLADLKDYNGESHFPNFLKYKDYLESIPKETLEQMRKQAENRKKMIERIKKLKRK